jgi:hypothetical protein
VKGTAGVLPKCRQLLFFSQNFINYCNVGGRH